MKSKMKSTFAIIAVALMVLVAVVPMVGVFTAPSDAAVPVNGDPDVGAGITIKVNVYKENGSADEGVQVKLTYGEKGEYTALSDTYSTTTTGCYTIVVKETLMTKGKLTVVDTTAEHKDVAGYPEKSIDTKLEKGDVKTYDIRSKYVYSGAIDIQLADGKKLSTLFGNVTDLKVTYKLYSDAEAKKEIKDTTGIATVTPGTGNNKDSISIDYQGTFTDGIWIKITGVAVQKTATSEVIKYTDITSSVIKVIGDQKQDITLGQAMITITAANIAIPSATVTVSKVYKLATPTDPTSAKTGEVSSVKAVYTDDVLKAAGSVNFYFDAAYTSPEAPAQPEFITPTNADLTVAFSSTVKDAMTAFIITDAYTPNGFYGYVGMDESTAGSFVGAYDGQSVTWEMKAKFTKTGETDKDVPSTLTLFVKDGKYVVMYKKPTAPAEGYTLSAYLVLVKSGDFAVKKVGTATPGADGYANIGTTIGEVGINFDKAGYTYVTGQINMADKNNLATGGTVAVNSKVSLVISGVSSAFGYAMSGNNVNITTSDAGAYTIYIKKYDEISFAPASSEKFTFTTSDSKILNADAYASTLVIATKTMKFKFTDGDGNALTGVTIKFKDENVQAPATTSTNGKTKLEELTICSSYMDLSTLKFYPTKEGNNFAYTAKNYATYTEGTTGSMAISSLNTTYTLNFADNNGTLVQSGATAPFQYAVYNVYENEGGSLIFDTTAPVKPLTDVTFTQGSVNMSFKIRSDYVDVDIGSTAVPVAVVVPANATSGAYYLEAYYLAMVSGNTMVITAKADSLTGTVVKTDKVTPISGVTVKLMKGNDVKYTTVSDSDGSFTVLSDVKLTDDFKLKFEDGLNGFDDDGYDVIKSSKKVTTFAATADYYLFILTDEDGSIVTLTEGYKLGGFGADITVSASGLLGGARAMTAGQIVNPTYKNDNVEVRTFDQYVVTAEDIESGIINLTTNESTYSIFVQDSEGAFIDAEGLPTVIYRENGIQVGDAIGGVAQDVDAYNNPITGKYHVVLSDLGTKTGEYAVEVSNNGPYKYLAVLPSTAVAFEDGIAVVESLYTTIYFAVTDAAGEKLPLVAGDSAGKKVTDGLTPGIDLGGVLVDSDLFWFIGDADLYYSPTAEWGFIAIPETDPVQYCYHVAQSAEIEDGAIAADEQEVTFYVTDANGEPLEDEAVTIKAYDILGNVKAVPVLNKELDDGKVSAIFAVDDYIYGISGVFLDAFEYTFDLTTGFAFVANEGTYYANFETANGYDLDDEMKINDYVIVAYDAAGFVTGYMDLLTNGYTVDLEKVAYFVAVDATKEYTFAPSETLNFVSTVSYITGSVPYSGKGNGGSVAIELYLEGNLVQEIKDPAKVQVVNKTEYIAIIDMTGYIGDTAGVVFDSILVVYYENNVEIATAVVDPFSTVNNIVSPTVQVYVAVLDAPSALISRHVSIAQVGNTATVSADGQFIVADDDAIYTDGQYIYTFAGWYVDNEKVSSAPSFTFSLTENVVIVPEYTVKYEKISDANAQVDPEIIIEEITKENTGIDTNVLIIGICAVIVALIAVVYAVIKKE